MTTILSAQALTKKYGARAALRDVALAIEAGRIHGLLGPNGSGKTTALHIITGLIPADRGTVRIDGIDVGDKASRRALGFAPDDLPLPAVLTGREYLRLHDALRGRDDASRADVLADALGIVDDLGTAMLLPFAIVAVALLALVPNATPIVPGIAGALPVLPFMLGLYTVGRTLRARWIPTLVTARRVVWIVPAALAQMAVSAAFAVAALGAVVLLGLLPVVQVPDVLLRCALASAVALAGGALVPYSEQQPLSVTAGGFLVGTLYALTSLGIGWAAENAAPGTDRVLVVAAIVAFAGFYALAALRQSVREPARA